MANGYALATGKLGVAIVVPGPGLLNASAAIATGFAQNAPTLCITGQIPSRFIGQGLGQLHEIKDQLSSVAGVTKFQGSVMRPGETPGIFARAISTALSDRTRPVVIEIPPDVLQAEEDVDFGSYNPEPIDTPLDASEVAEAAELIAAAQKPLIFAGSGAYGASAALTKLAETLGAPVVMSQHGPGAVDYRNPLAHTMYSGIDLWREADLALAVGTRFTTPMLSWGYDDAIKLVRIDPDSVQSVQPWKPDVHIRAKAEYALPAIERLLREKGNQSNWDKGNLANRKSDAERTMAGVLPLTDEFTRALRAAIPDDGIICFDQTQLGYHAYWGGYPTYQPGTFVRTSYQGTLGFAFPTSLGVKVGAPNRTVVCVSGDGGMMFAVQELATAAQEGINLINVVMNDQAYGNIKRTQAETYGGNFLACELQNPSFAELARVFGVIAMTASTPAELTGAIRRAQDVYSPVLIEVPVGAFPSWPGVVPRRRVRGLK
jgi:acetolactate synthase-1/2/3 large subunit